MEVQPDRRGVEALTGRRGEDSLAHRIRKESTPIFDQLMTEDLGGAYRLTCQPATWIPLIADPLPWNWDKPEYRLELPALPMSAMVHLVADRIRLLDTPTSAWPVVDSPPLAGLQVQA